jgi:8-oxo-dGTP diphosphatase
MKLPTHIVAVGAIIENDQNEIILINHHIDGWVFPGGIVENKESLTDGLKGEVYEETGTEIEIQRLIGISTNVSQYPGYNNVDVIPIKLILDFICKHLSGSLKRSSENDSTIWVKKENVLSYIYAPEIKERYRAYLNMDKETNYLVYETKPEYKLINKDKF